MPGRGPDGELELCLIQRAGRCLSLDCDADREAAERSIGRLVDSAGPILTDKGLDIVEKLVLLLAVLLPTAILVPGFSVKA
jgi:hypothetical protein